MPQRITDSDTGAVFFVPTPEEAHSQKLNTELEEKLKILDGHIGEVQELKKQLQEELKKYKF